MGCAMYNVVPRKSLLDALDPADASNDADASFRQVGACVASTEVTWQPARTVPLPPSFAASSAACIWLTSSLIDHATNL